MTLATPGRRTRLLFTTGLLAASLVLAGCSGGTEEPTSAPTDESTVDPFAPEQTSVTTIGYRQTSAAPWFAAVDEGYPEEYGLTEFTYEFGENSPAILTSLVGGSGQFGSVSIPSVIDAVNQGIEIVIVGENFRDVPGNQVMVALESSGIESIEDLDGKTVGLVGLNSGHHNRLRYVMQLEDIDYSNIEFVNVPYGEMASSLETGVIDAGVLTGALLATVEQTLDLNEVFDFATGPLAGLSSLQWVATKAFAEANPNTVAAFQCAVVYRGAKLVAEDDEAYFAAMTNPDLGFTREALEASPKVNYPAANDPEAMQINATIQYAVGLSPEEFDIATITIPLPTNCGD